MISKKNAALAGMIVLVILFQNCSKSNNAVLEPTVDPAIAAVLNLPATPYNYIANVPAYIQPALQANDNTPADNAITNDGATLGRVLFYDKSLSQNNTISCASCHKQNLSFGDDAVKSLGFSGGSTRRHSMRTINVRYYSSGKMFWDERAATLEQQVLMPIQDATEMGMTLPDLVTKLSAKSYYAPLFQKAFGSTQITSDKISKALAQFVRSIVTYNSKYDRVKQGQETFTPAEQQGEQLFLTAGPAPCGSCHRPPMFITSNPAAPFALQDPSDSGINNQNRFKVGSLRNIASVTTFFHNGSVPTLNTMLTSRIPAHGVAPQDVATITAFLQTLTDNSITTDVRFSNPFK
jgi:cytochrome c peroxidase